MTATARDASGNEARATLPIVVQNAPTSGDTIPPTVTIEVKPTDGLGGISGVVTVTVTATDNVAVTNVTVTLFDLLTGEQTLLHEEDNPPRTLSFSWDSRSAPNGIYAIDAKATDPSGNSGFDTFFAFIDNP